VVGNTNANVTNSVIANKTTTTFELADIAGNAPWTSGGTLLSVPTVTVKVLAQSR